MSNTVLRPYQQAVIDRLMAAADENGKLVYDLPTGHGLAFNPYAVRATESEGRFIVDIESGGLHAVNAVKVVNMAAAERRVSREDQRTLRNAMFGIRYGKTWTRDTLSKSHVDNAQAFFQDVPASRPPRKTLMYYHVQHALSGW